MICRIDLTKTQYKRMDFKLLGKNDFASCEQIYKQYIEHNEIENPHPVFEEEWNREAKYNAFASMLFTLTQIPGVNSP